MSGCLKQTGPTILYEKHNIVLATRSNSGPRVVPYCFQPKQMTMPAIASRIPSPPFRSRRSPSSLIAPSVPSKSPCQSEIEAPNVPSEPKHRAIPCQRSQAPQDAVLTTIIPISPLPASKTSAAKPLNPPSRSSYVSPHLGEPCSVRALDHKLSCGHKVLTMQPEECAANCSQPRCPHIVGNPHRSAEPFICMACITETVQRRQMEDAVSFRDELNVVARETDKPDPAVWVREKIDIMSIAWEDRALKEMAAMVGREGRICQAFYVVPELEELAGRVLRWRAKADGKKESTIGESGSSKDVGSAIPQDEDDTRRSQALSHASSLISRPSSSGSASRLPKPCN